eukprot:INCI11315.1.p1 GENE.INCI11315.1~~INCI11315.1.p1  ORF type:complete len:206 (-),score=23.31 INCI11315.1:332-949(-)
MDKSSGSEAKPWITWFCELRGNEFFCEVPIDYIEDNFNLYGLNAMVPHYDFALDTILDYEIDFDKIRPTEDAVEAAAESLYGLIHARYIITARGMRDMTRKYNKAMFGRCHRVSCQGQRVLPVGQSDMPRLTTVNVFCPRCKEIYFPKSRRQGNIDGAFFGTTFAHLFLLTYPEPNKKPVLSAYEPRIFGFRINRNSEYFTGRSK